MPKTAYGKIRRVNIQSVTTKIKTQFLKVPLVGRIVGGVVLVSLLSYGLVFIPVKQINFSFAGNNCFNHFLLAPSVQQTSSDDFTLVPEDETKLGNAALFSTKLCVEPSESPNTGDYTVANAPFGSFFGAKHFSISVPEVPTAIQDDFIGKEISATQPLEVRLTKSDTLHEYSLEIDDKASVCDHSNSKLSCDVAALNLKQGADYEVALYREFNDSDKEKLAEGELTTVLPLKQTKSSITNKKVLYNAPKDFSFSFDQPLVSAEFTLRRLDGDKTEDIATTHNISEKTLKVVLDEPLAREASFRLTLSQVVASNGSSLDAPVTVNFSTSGGPKVKSVSIGAHSVSANAQIVITFDQPIHDDVDIAKFVRTTGAPYAVNKISKTQVTVTLKNAKNCSGFTVVVDKGIKSGSNGETSKEGWSHSSRVLCGYSWQIGTSVRGRPIIAYSFGSGSKVILFTGGIHGSEPSSTSTMQAWAHYLQAYGNIIPANKRVVIVPNTNPDGIATGSRNNARNVNLGRNFPTANWKADIETANGTLKNGGGKSAGSEPEAKALIALTRQLRPRLEVSFHAQGSLVGANKFADSVKIGDIYASTTGYATMYYNAEAVMGYPMTGEYEDWMGEEMGIPAILIELPTHQGNYLDSQLAALRKMLNV